MRRKFVNCINLKLNNEPLHIERIAHCIHTTNLIIYIAMYNARLYLNCTMYNVRCTNKINNDYAGLCSRSMIKKGDTTDASRPTI